MSDPIRKIDQSSSISDTSRPHVLQSNEFAQQISSSKSSLMEKIEGHQTSKWQNLPGFKIVDTYFSQRVAKKNMIAETREKFLILAPQVGISRENAGNVFDNQILPHLNKAQIEHVPLFKVFIDHRAGTNYFLSPIANESINEKKVVRIISANYHKAMEIMSQDPQIVRRIFNAYEETDNILDTMESSEKYTILDRLISDNVIPPKGQKQDGQALNRYEQLILHGAPLRQHLITKSTAQRGAFLRHILTKQGHQHIMNALNSNAGNPAGLANAINQAIAIQQSKDSLQMQLALTLALRASKIIDKQEHETAFIEAWAKSAEEMEPSNFDLFLKRFSEHLVLIETIKAEYPQGIDTTKSDLIANSYNKLIKDFPAQKRHFDSMNTMMLKALTHDKL